MANIFTDKKGLFQGGEEGRFLGRLRDKIDALKDRRSNPQEKIPDMPGTSKIRPEVLRGDKGFTGPPLTDEEKAYMRSRYAKDTLEGLAEYTERAKEGLKSLRETGSLPSPNDGLLGGPANIIRPIHGGRTKNYAQIGITDKPLTPHQEQMASMSEYVENNPNVTRADINRKSKELRNLAYEKTRGEQKDRDAALRVAQLSGQASARDIQIAKQTQLKINHFRKQAERLGIINISDKQLQNMNWAKLKKYQMAEKDKVEKYIGKGFSESEAIKLIAGKFTTKDVLGKDFVEESNKSVQFQKNALGDLYRN